MHSSQMYFIDRQGRERFVADPMVDHTASGSSYLPAGQLASRARASPWSRASSSTERVSAV